MRWLLLATALLCQNLQAEEVTVTGYGSTVDVALQNAKTAAVEQVAGTFITGKSTLDGDQYRSRTDQYNGGLIKRHEILSTIEQDGLFAVRIQADVDTDKVNSVIESNGAEITAPVADRIEKSRDDFEKTKRIIEALDDPAQAFAVQVKNVTYRNQGDLTKIIAQIEIIYSPKWYDDVHLMAKTIGREIDTGAWWREALWGLAALSAAFNPALPGTLFSIARQAEVKPKSIPEYIACFGKDNGWGVDECYEIRHPLSRTTGSSEIKLVGRLIQGDEVLNFGEVTIYTAEELFMSVWDGRKAYFQKSARPNRSFHNPGIVLFRKGAATVMYEITVPTEKLKHNGRLEFAELQGG
ncbi:MAG: hypothetical protein B7Z35_07810 [Hydrogenophilales bacterium 12-61-10]|nr:MAG: hypothetical protein B7Z35_07810 [Hydrogenophilales bacterium 12-61-10]OYX30128.1 MAG: hypothetical protein B7Z03_06990 [Hydrogenophilales bacterium 32-62-9]